VAAAGRRQPGWFEASPPTVRTFRRGLFAIFAAMLLAGAIRLRGRGGVPPQHGGWRELSGSDLT